mgnify:CR=1 FL=1
MEEGAGGKTTLVPILVPWMTTSKWVDVWSDEHKEVWEFHIRSRNDELVAITVTDKATSVDLVFYVGEDDAESVTLYRDLPDHPGFRERMHLLLDNDKIFGDISINRKIFSGTLRSQSDFMMQCAKNDEPSQVPYHDLKQTKKE